MATAATLRQAAGQSFDNLNALWLAGGVALKNALLAFANTLLPVFPDAVAVGRPIADWLTLIAASSASMPTTQAAYSMFVVANDYVYRLCWLASIPTVSSPNITLAQQAAVLTAYNANF